MKKLSRTFGKTSPYSSCALPRGEQSRLNRGKRGKNTKSKVRERLSRKPIPQSTIPFFVLFFVFENDILSPSPFPSCCCSFLALLCSLFLSLSLLSLSRFVCAGFVVTIWSRDLLEGQRGSF